MIQNPANNVDFRNRRKDRQEMFCRTIYRLCRWMVGSEQENFRHLVSTFPTQNFSNFNTLSFDNFRLFFFSHPDHQIRLLTFLRLEHRHVYSL